MVVTFVYLNRGESLTSGQLEETIEVYRNAFSHPPYNEFFTVKEVNGFLETLLAKGNMILAQLDGRVVGMIAGFELTPSSYCIDEFAVLSTCQGHGIGTKLLSELLERTRAYEQLELRTSHLQTPAHRMYRRFGFVDSDKLEFVPQFRQNARLELDRRVYMSNNFKLNHIVIAETTDSVSAIIFDNDTGFDLKRLQALINKAWAEIHSTNAITHFCFVSTPSNPDNIARIDTFQSSDFRLEPIAFALSSERDYTGTIELSSGLEVGVQVDGDNVIINGVDAGYSVAILHDGPMKLARSP